MDQTPTKTRTVHHDLRMVGEYAARLASRPGDDEYADGLRYHLRKAHPDGWGFELGEPEYDANCDAVLEAVLGGMVWGGGKANAIEALTAIAEAWRTPLDPADIVAAREAA